MSQHDDTILSVRARFAEKADLVLVLFDTSKVDVSDEMKEV